MKKNLIVCMVIGNRYRRQYQALKEPLKAYADKCDADIKLITNLPDKLMKRNVLAQKLLIPSMFPDYQRLALLDLDVIINKNAPNIFNENVNAGFSACVDPRSSDGFQNTCEYVWRQPKILEETDLSYFTSRGFVADDALKHSINGGVMLMNPNWIGDLFKNAYYSDLPMVSHEEAIAAYISQINGFFEPLNHRYNIQVIHELSAELGLAFRASQTRYFSLLRKMQRLVPSILNEKMYPPSYRKLMARLIDANYIIHFSGDYPYAGLQCN